MQEYDYSQDPIIKPEINLLLHWIAKFGLWVLRWRVEGDVSRMHKAVVIAAPHTSNLDGLFLLFTAWQQRRNIRWMIKAEWTRLPIIGWLLKQTGAIGIDRSAAVNRVDQMIAAFHSQKSLLLVVPPEGTRSHTEYWKSGFYWIAEKAEVPLFPVRLDYSRRVTNLTAPLLIPSGDIESDMETITALYKPEMARYPERFGPLRVRTKRSHSAPSSDATEVETPSDAVN